MRGERWIKSRLGLEMILLTVLSFARVAAHAFRLSQPLVSYHTPPHANTHHRIHTKTHPEAYMYVLLPLSYASTLYISLTGRFSIRTTLALLSEVFVERDGAQHRLEHIGVISVRNKSTLMVTLFDEAVSSNHHAQTRFYR